MPEGVPLSSVSLLPPCHPANEAVKLLAAHGRHTSHRSSTEPRVASAPNTMAKKQDLKNLPKISPKPPRLLRAAVGPRIAQHRMKPWTSSCPTAQVLVLGRVTFGGTSVWARTPQSRLHHLFSPMFLLHHEPALCSWDF